MRTDHSQAPSLRGRKKLATRNAISTAALRLAIERGPEHVRVADGLPAPGDHHRTPP